MDNIWYPAVFRGGYAKKKDLKEVAFTGSYNNLNDIPRTFTAAPHKHCKSDITDFPTSLPASDVHSWAKQPNKPSYSASEVGAAASNHGHPNYIAGQVSSGGYTQVGAIAGARDSSWLQLPQNDNGGLLPCTPIDTDKAAPSQGHQNIGHSGWPFLRAYINKIHPVEIIGSTDWMSIFVPENGNNRGMQVLTNALIPLPDNHMHLGGGSWRWKQVAAVNSTISTSDRRQKKEISYIGQESDYDTNMTDEQLITFMRGLRAVVFKRYPNDSDRPHHGFIAQDFEELLKKTGLHDHAAFIKSPKTEIVEIEEEEEVEFEVLDPEAEGGKRIEKLKQKVTKKREVSIPDEYIYGMRYEELISDDIHFTQLLWDKNEKQHEEIEELRKRITELENIIKGA